MMHWESMPELHAFQILDCDVEVKGFSEQPCVVHYLLEGIGHRHFPDVLVRYADRVELWEVKTSQDANEPDVIARTQLLTAELPRLGYQYRLILADELATQPRLGNATLLLRFGRMPVSAMERELIRRTFQEVRGLAWGTVCSGAIGPRGCGIICGLTLEGSLCVDMTAPIVASTIFRLRRGAS